MTENDTNWKICNITQRKYRLGTIQLSKAKNSIFNPRVEKSKHVEDIRESMKEEGQLTPLTCVETDVDPKGNDIEILDGKHRFAAAIKLDLTELDAKIYSKDLTPLEKKKIAIYLNKGVKKINAGEFFRVADELHRLTENQLKEMGARYINEERIVSTAGLRSSKDIFEITIGRIVHKLQNGDILISEYISDAQTPRRIIETGETVTVLTAQNVASFLTILCKDVPVGIWEPELHNLTDEEYETKMLNGLIKDEKDLREIEFKNVSILMNMIASELLKHWLDRGDYDKLTTFCKHHVLRGSALVIKRIIQSSGSKVESAPLYTEDIIDWGNVKKHILKFKDVDWSNEIFQERVPKLISDYLMRCVF